MITIEAAAAVVAVEMVEVGEVVKEIEEEIEIEEGVMEVPKVIVDGNLYCFFVYLKMILNK
jgi:hypothetical protein